MRSGPPPPASLGSALGRGLLLCDAVDAAASFEDLAGVEGHDGSTWVRFGEDLFRGVCLLYTSPSPRDRG